ncbi:MAG: hypothetical protein Q9208_008028 [Pyrenodesmia sp. 3 TL-2023]
MDSLRGRFSISRLRVKHAQLSVGRDGAWERLDDSYTSSSIQRQKDKMFAPWNVENLMVQSDGTIELYQYGSRYSRTDHLRGQRVLTEDEYAWCARFRLEKRTRLTVGEIERIPGEPPKRFVQLKFVYDGRPEGRDATVMAPKEPTSLGTAKQDHSKGDNESIGGQERHEAEELRAEEEGEEANTGETDAGMESEGVENDEVDSEEDPCDPSAFPLARLCNDDAHEPRGLEVRIVFERRNSQNANVAVQWWWPAACKLLVGWGSWFPTAKKEVTQREVALALEDWVKSYGNKADFTAASFIAVPQSSPGWTVFEVKANRPSAVQMQRSASTLQLQSAPSHAPASNSGNLDNQRGEGFPPRHSQSLSSFSNVPVPAFGAPLPTPANATPSVARPATALGAGRSSTSSHDASAGSQAPAIRRRSRKEIEAEEDELMREDAERQRAYAERMKRLREEYRLAQD